MKRLIMCGLAVTWLAGSAMATDAYDDTGAWYLAPLAQYDYLDKSRIANNHAGFQVGIGYDFAPHFAAELAASNGSFRIPSLGTHERLTAIGLDGLYKFLPVTAMWRPFMLVGTGSISDSIGPGPHALGWMAEAGGGVLMAVGSQAGSTRFQLRGEVKYRREFIQNINFIPNNPGDIVAGVGFQWMFGAQTPPPPPPVARELPPPAAAEPPPPPPPPAPEPCHAPAGFQVDADCRIIEQTLVVRAVDFEFNSMRLTEPARETLDEVGAALLKQPDMQVEIQGYTDSIGTDAYNLTLSQKRAQAVKAYLVSKGLSETSLTAKGYGKADPIASNASKEGRAQNRRVAFAVTNAPAHVKVVTKDATDASTEAAKQNDPIAVKPKH